MNSNNNRPFKTIVILVITVVLIVLILIGVSLYDRHQNGHNTQYYDKYSGQTLSTIKGKTPEAYGEDDNKPSFLGFQTLVEHGFTQDQLGGVETGIENYADQSKVSVKNVSFDVSSFKRLGTASSGTGNNEVTFTIVLDFKQKYSADVIGDGISFISLRLATADGQQVFNYSSNPDASGPSN